MQLPSMQNNVPAINRNLPVIFVLAILFEGLFASSQSIRGITMDIQSRKPVPYTTIKVMNAPLGVVADSTGHYILRQDSVKQVLFTSIGYRDTIISSLAIGDTTFLTPSPEALATVVIRTWKRGKTYVVGNGASLIGKLTRCDSRTSGFVYSVDKASSCVKWGPGGAAEWAEKIVLPDSTAAFRLKKIWIPAGRSSDRSPNGDLFLHIYETTDSGMPGTEILRTVLRPRSMSFVKGKIVLDLTSENLVLEKDFVIGVSWPTATNHQDPSMIILVQSYEGISYSRSLYHPDYSWFVAHVNTNEEVKGKLHTIYAAELERVD